MLSNNSPHNTCHKQQWVYIAMKQLYLSIYTFLNLATSIQNFLVCINHKCVHIQHSSVYIPYHTIYKSSEREGNKCLYIRVAKKVCRSNFAKSTSANFTTQLKERKSNHIASTASCTVASYYEFQNRFHHHPAVMLCSDVPCTD